MAKQVKRAKLPYNIDIVVTTFELTRNKGCAFLDKWLENPLPIEPSAAELIEECRKELDDRGELWNEAELKMNFLSIIFRYAKLYQEGKYAIFYERIMCANLKGYELSVICDSLIARPIGRYTPDIPYFFLQEFKPQHGKFADAEAQLLQAMLVAQHENKSEKPLYGAVLQGKYWTFTVLHQKNYCVSRDYNATNPQDLQTILSALVRLKEIIVNELS